MAESSSYKEYVAGLVAGVATVITGHPFDTVKVTLIIQIISACMMYLLNPMFHF